MFGFSINNSFTIEFHCSVENSQWLNYVYLEKELYSLSSCCGNYNFFFFWFIELIQARERQKLCKRLRQYILSK